jgi:PAS domain S-box-containing protein
MGDAWSGVELDRLGRAVLERTPDAIVLADREGVIRFWNAGAERLFGFAAAEALGRSLDIIIPVPQRARHWAGFARVMETGESRYGAGEVLAVPGLRKDGGRVSLEFTIVPLQDAVGRMEGMAAILRDVTRRFEELRALRRQVAAAREGGPATPQSGTDPAPRPPA